MATVDNPLTIQPLTSAAPIPPAPSTSTLAPEAPNTEIDALTSADPGPSRRPNNKDVYQPQRFNIIEALSATGLRSIRYAQEIPGAQ